VEVPVERENNPLALDGDVTAQLHNPFMSVVPVVHNLANLHRPKTVVGARGKFLKTYGALHRIATNPRPVFRIHPEQHKI
jgi:hypothetical protein